jgi:excisionase family DNA binding protein
MALTTMAPREVARTLGIRLDAVYSLIWAGKLPADKVEGQWSISRAAVEARLASKTRRKAPSANQEHVELTKSEVEQGAKSERLARDRIRFGAIPGQVSLAVPRASSQEGKAGSDEQN